MLDLLRGLKVVDLTTVVLGPYATQLLADFGAEVTKVEPLEGDGFRAVRPGRHAQLGVGFMNFNRNKRAVALDLTASGQRNTLSLGRRCRCICAQHAQQSRSATRY